jgi:DinB family protein
LQFKVGLSLPARQNPRENRLRVISRQPPIHGLSVKYPNFINHSRLTVPTVSKDSTARTARDRRTIFLMPESDLPCLDFLEATPEILRGLMREISDDDARWKPAPDRFSIAEVLAHLSHSDSHCYRMRVDRFLTEEKPSFESDDAQMHLDLYRDADPKEAFDHFEKQRESNIGFLKNLPPGSGNRKANHAEVGEITLAQMLHEWALHDIGHIRQVAELVRARKYRNGAGPLGKSYRLHP